MLQLQKCMFLLYNKRELIWINLFVMRQSPLNSFLGYEEGSLFTFEHYPGNLKFIEAKD